MMDRGQARCVCGDGGRREGCGAKGARACAHVAKPQCTYTHNDNVERKYVEAWGFLHKVIQENQRGIAGSPAPLQHPHNLVRSQYNHLCCYTRNNMFLNVLWDLGNISFMRIMCLFMFGARGGITSFHSWDLRANVVKTWLGILGPKIWPSLEQVVLLKRSPRVTSTSNNNVK